jgi:NADH-quinone oxidoreductase subunit N
MVLGLGLMVKSANLLLLYLSVEVVSISSYVLTALLRERKHAAEAGLKYVLFGAMASGVMIYGMSFLYGFSGTLTFADPAFGLNLEQAPNGLLVIGVVLTFLGFFFKAGAAPMHIWAPDVYEGAPTPVAALFSTAPKIAAVLVIARFLPSLPGSIWTDFLLPMLAVVAMASIIIGTFGALRQQTVKRLLAFSSIAHIGFMLMPLLGGGATGMMAIFFYATVLLITNFGVFAMVQAIEGQREELLIADWAGLGKLLPGLGVTMVVQMIALTGLPPTGGFTAKLLMFSSVWEQFERLNSALLLWLLIVGLLLTVVSLFYYLRLPYTMFFKGTENQPKLAIPVDELMVIVGLAVLSLAIFFKANWLVELIKLVVGE